MPSGLLRNIVLAIALGALSGACILLLDSLVFAALDPDGIGSIAASDAHPSAWMGFLASFYGGIGEEIQMRLFLMSFLVLIIGYLARKFSRSVDSGVPASIYISTIFLVAIIFGLGHLPATAELVPLTPLVILRAIILNGILGVIAGFLFWKRGIEMAMVCHFSADIILHVIFPLL